MAFSFGIDQLLLDHARVKKLQNCRAGLVAHPASITGSNLHSMDALVGAGCNIVRAFGPQHGMRGDKQDNMIESADYLDPRHHLPVTSLYGEHRRATDDMLEDLDVVLFDLQDIGCRIYTYITTLFHFVQSCRRLGVELWVLDRPNPAGRPVDGLYLEPGQESFVGCAPMPVRHGLTVGELAYLFWSTGRGSQAPPPGLSIITMTGYDPDAAPGFGWPSAQRPWINPSPNASSLNMARCFPGTVLLEGTTLSEGRGTTTALEVIGAPDLDVPALLERLTAQSGSVIASWSGGVMLRPCFFSPTFHKHHGKLCAGIQFHTDYPGYDHQGFKPYRLIAGMLKLIRMANRDYPLWRHHEYEYELERIPIDVINGGPSLRDWVDNPDADFESLDRALAAAAIRWEDERAPFLVY